MIRQDMKIESKTSKKEHFTREKEHSTRESEHFTRGLEHFTREAKLWNPHKIGIFWGSIFPNR